MRSLSGSGVGYDQAMSVDPFVADHARGGATAAPL